MTDSAGKYLVFTLAGRPFAFDLAQVAEVVEQPGIWPVPLASACYAGAMNFHGTIVAVLDLAMFLGLPGTSGVSRALVLDTHCAALAFSVEAVSRITAPEPSAISNVPGDHGAIGFLDLPEGNVPLLDAASIAERAAATVNDRP